MTRDSTVEAVANKLCGVLHSGDHYTDRARDFVAALEAARLIYFDEPAQRVEEAPRGPTRTELLAAAFGDAWACQSCRTAINDVVDRLLAAGYLKAAEPTKSLPNSGRVPVSASLLDIVERSLRSGNAVMALAEAMAAAGIALVRVPPDYGHPRSSAFRNGTNAR